MYKSLAGNYDQFVNWQNRLAFEIPFLVEQLIPQRSDRPLRVLDAACGTGMHVIELARRGFDCAGADLVPEMITQARLNAANAGVNIRFEAAGFGQLAHTFTTGSFDALLCLGNSLPHVLTTKALAESLADFSACLRPGGRVFIQNRNFNAVLARRDRWMEPQAAAEGNNEWLFQRFYDFEPDGLIRFNIVTLKRSGHGDWRSEVSSTFLYPQTQAEIESALRTAGFYSIHSFGSMQGEPFDPLSSGNLIISAVKKS